MQFDDFCDPTTRPFWEGANDRKLLLQRCGGCRCFQFYPRPVCLSCGGRDLAWVEAAGEGTIYSMTIVRTPVISDLTPPYTVGLVELAEGPRMLGEIRGEGAAIGASVRLAWRDREGLPPIPAFTLSDGGSHV